MAGTIFFCKMCGRTMRADEKPNFCSFDRVDHIENVSDEDAVKMGVNIPEGETYEFPGDVRWEPFTGNVVAPVDGYTLQQFQREVMERVL